MDRLKTWLKSKQNLLWFKYIAYLIRWQLSTPILAWCCFYFATLGETWAATISNLIGGLIFFWVDKFIFKPKELTRGELVKLYFEKLKEDGVLNK